MSVIFWLKYWCLFNSIFCSNLSAKWKAIVDSRSLVRREAGWDQAEDRPGDWWAGPRHRRHTPCCCTPSPRRHTRARGPGDRHTGGRQLSCSISLSWSFSSVPSGSCSGRYFFGSPMWIYRVWRPSVNTGILLLLFSYNCDQVKRGVSDLLCSTMYSRDLPRKTKIMMANKILILFVRQSRISN